jgi:hypothetical protein
MMSSFLNPTSLKPGKKENIIYISFDFVVQTF